MKLAALVTRLRGAASARVEARADVVDWKQFTRAARRLLWSDRMLRTLHYLNDAGWNDGGCRILAEANLLWLGPLAERYVLIDRKQVQHVVVRVGDRYLDGDGASTERTLLRRWRREGLERPFLLADPDAKLANASERTPEGIPSNHALSARLATQLELELGAFFQKARPGPVLDPTGRRRSSRRAACPA